jgi:cobalt transporter subunit CbtB
MTAVSGTQAVTGAAPDTMRIAAVAAFLLGFALFLGAGFAGASVLHNATHDTRHAFAMPCH